MNLVRTPIVNQYIWKLIIRIVIVTAVAVTYFMHRDILNNVLTQPALESLKDVQYWPFITLWALLMAMMARHLLPPRVFTMALLKQKEERLDLDPNYKKERLLQYVQKQNVKAWYVMLIWVLFNGVIGMLYLSGILQVADMFLFTTFFFLCDYICILFYCPFQTHIMHNKCCVNCRIYDWDSKLDIQPDAVSMRFVPEAFAQPGPVSGLRQTDPFLRHAILRLLHVGGGGAQHHLAYQLRVLYGQHKRDHPTLGGAEEIDVPEP